MILPKYLFSSFNPTKRGLNSKGLPAIAYLLITNFDSALISIILFFVASLAHNDWGWTCSLTNAGMSIFNSASAITVDSILILVVFEYILFSFHPKPRRSFKHQGKLHYSSQKPFPILATQRLKYSTQDPVLNYP